MVRSIRPSPPPGTSRGGRTGPLISDGIFHTLIWLITVWGLFMPADLRRHIHVPWGRWATAVALGIGVFQLFDGVVNHKILRIHQIRSGVDLFF
ncbi:hypothetical protein GCM10027580_07270 [Corynebacterium faecale]|uniref:DUF2243 domain-containing protein n=1 Tax=Corynebacterium faecale TaxID=1758466 RepID=UPI0025B492E5|nr:DUF2243 domain-containing protein [Corynebacterium faecale]